jgi:hypothetical protein
LCITAKLIVEWQRWVIRYRSVRLHVRNALKGDGLATVDMGHSTKSLCDSGEVWLVLSIIPRGEIVGSGGSALS